MEVKEKMKIIFEIVKNYYYSQIPNLPKYSEKIRKRELVEIRQITYYLCLKYLKCKFQDLADMTNKKSHATTLHGVKTINNLILSDKNLRERIKVIEELVQMSEINSKIIYLAGSISLNLKRHGKEYTDNLFLEAENEIKNDSDVVINPNKLFSEEELETFTQIQFMERCIKYLFNCNVIYMLKDYKESYNACIELEIAKNLNIKILYQ